MELFVDEILARSRTTGAVLQVALNYIDVLRPKLVQLVQSSPPKELSKYVIHRLFISFITMNY